MIAIVDSGSTKSDWVVLENDFEEVFRANTIGFNPYFINSEEIEQELRKNEDLMGVAERLEKVFFYGAGCSSESLRKVVQVAFDKVFVNAKNVIDHDLKAAAYAAYDGKPAVVCILGTGSNSCYFDGESIYEATPSLAYILGDEGSGNHLGRELVKAYFTNKLPENLHKAFDERYNLSIEKLNKNVYDNKFANAYLATFSRFVADYKSEPFIMQIIYRCLSDFFYAQVLPYPQIKEAEINFIGSVAHYYEDTLRAVAAEYNLRVGEIVTKPINNLVRYHKQYLSN
ncbi:MAG: ATPase [Weeksellaceae bacterium]|nr:ATPase [Weeksellaceae bacterium]